MKIDRIEIKNDYVSISLSGDYELNKLKSLAKVIYDECEKAGLLKTIVDMRDIVIVGNVPTMDRFFLGEEVSKIFGSKVKAAFVNQTKHVTKFAETVAVNRGANVRVFDSIDSAVHWLEEK